MNEELKQIATKAREHGFKARTVTTIYTEKFLLGEKKVMLNDMCFYLYLCDLQEWLRSKYNIFLTIQYDLDISKKSFILPESQVDESGCFKIGACPYRYNSYQEALQEGIKESLKLIK